MVCFEATARCAVDGGPGDWVRDPEMSLNASDPFGGTGEPAMAELGDDLRLEETLFETLLELDHLISQVEREKNAEKKSMMVIRALAESVNKVVELAEMARIAAPEETSLISALQFANRVYPEARLINARRANRISVESVVNLFRYWAEDPADRPFIFRNICLTMAYLLENYFALLERVFRTPEIANEWTWVYKVYCGRLNTLVRNVHF